MYINIEAVNSIAKLIGSVGIIFGVLVTLYKFVERDRRQSKLIESIISEQNLLCYGIKACLQGLVEQGIQFDFWVHCKPPSYSLCDFHIDVHGTVGAWNSPYIVEEAHGD